MIACGMTPLSVARRPVAAKSSGIVPPSFQLPRLRPISSQTKRAACVGNALADLVEHEIERLHGSCPDLSRAMAWHHGRLSTGSQHEDVGCYIGAAVANTEFLGLCSEAVWPYEYGLEEPGLLAIVEASRNLVTFDELSYARDAYAQLALGKPVIFGTVVGKAFQSLKPGELYGALESERSGHAMVAVGYDERGVTVRNSWGADWCDGGYGLLSREYFESYAYDLHVVSACQAFVTL